MRLVAVEKGRQRQLCYSLDSQTVTVCLLHFSIYLRAQSEMGATLVVLAPHGGLHSSPTQDSKRTDVVLASCIFTDLGRVTDYSPF